MFNPSRTGRRQPVRACVRVLVLTALVLLVTPGVGGAQTGPSESVAALGLRVALRGVGAAGILLAVGAVVFSGVVARDEADRAAARRLGLQGAVAGAAVAALALVLEAAGRSGDGVLAPAVALASLAGFALLWWRQARWPVLVLPAAAALVALAGGGHAHVAEPTWVLVGNVLHLGAGGVWFGGAAVLVRRLRERADESPPVDAAALVARFSDVALAAAVGVVVGGLVVGAMQLGTPTQLVRSPYGWTLVAKGAGVAVALVVTLYNRRWLVPAISGGVASAGRQAAWRRLHHTVRWEAGLLVVALLLGAVSTVRGAATPVGAAAPFDAVVALTDAIDVDVVVEPNTVGRNTIHVYALDGVGRPTTEVQNLRLELRHVERGVGPVVVDPFPAGPGHWIASVDVLRFTGPWRLDVVGELDDGTPARTRVDLQVPR